MAINYGQLKPMDFGEALYAHRATRESLDNVAKSVVDGIKFHQSAIRDTNERNLRNYLTSVTDPIQASSATHRQNVLDRYNQLNGEIDKSFDVGSVLRGHIDKTREDYLGTDKFKDQYWLVNNKELASAYVNDLTPLLNSGSLTEQNQAIQALDQRYSNIPLHLRQSLLATATAQANARVGASNNTLSNALNSANVQGVKIQNAQGLTSLFTNSAQQGLVPAIDNSWNISKLGSLADSESQTDRLAKETLKIADGLESLPKGIIGTAVNPAIAEQLAVQATEPVVTESTVTNHVPRVKTKDMYGRPFWDNWQSVNPVFNYPAPIPTTLPTNMHTAYTSLPTGKNLKDFYLAINNGQMGLTK